MDWALHDHQSDGRSREPRLARLRVYWRMVGPSQKPIICALYRTEAGLEVRAERSADDLLRSELVQTEESADTYAAAWRAVLDALGGFAAVDE